MKNIHPFRYRNTKKAIINRTRLPKDAEDQSRLHVSNLKNLGPNFQEANWLETWTNHPSVWKKNLYIGHKFIIDNSDLLIIMISTCHTVDFLLATFYWPEVICLSGSKSLELTPLGPKVNPFIKDFQKECMRTASK